VRGVDEFPFVSDGTLFPDVVRDVGWVSVPARSRESAANLWVRVAGLARFDVDPQWDDDDPSGWKEGQLVIIVPNSPQGLSLGDVITAYAATGSFRVMKRDEEGSTDDFGIAIDGVSNVGISASGCLTVTLQAGYKGDCWLLAVTFGVDLLVYRPSLDNVAPPAPPHWTFGEMVRQALQDAFTRLTH
jgi:hypothetical protein